MFEQRDIVLIPFPYTDLTGAKLRPALIISNGKLNSSEDRICCLVTSNQTDDGVLVNHFEAGNLPFKSWIKPYRLFTIHEKIIKKKLCKISANLHQNIIQEINNYIV